MKSRVTLLRIGLVVALVVAGRGAEVINDGTTVNNLIRLSNLVGGNGAEAELSVDQVGSSPALLAQQVVEGLPFFALRNVWYAGDRSPTNGVYAVSAEFLPAAAGVENRGGVMGWLDAAVPRGVGFYVRPMASPDAPAAFVVATVDFSAPSGELNETVAGLFNLDGSPAEFNLASAEAELGGYDPLKFARLELAFSPPTSADRQALASVTARVAARVIQADASGAAMPLSRTIELLTDLAVPLPANHRLGYFGYWGSIFGTGAIGYFRGLSATGGLGTPPNLPPTVSLVEPLDGTVLTVPAEVILAAEVGDPDGTVTKVEFFSGTSPLGLVVSSGAPLSRAELVWSNAPAGTYLLTAKATDNRGAATTSTNVVRITLDAGTPPELSIDLQENQVIVSWPDSYSGYVLQESAALNLPNWAEVPGVTGNRAILTPVGAARFLRLAR
jgi:hypothetical protein